MKTTIGLIAFAALAFSAVDALAQTNSTEAFAEEISRCTMQMAYGTQKEDYDLAKRLPMLREQVLDLESRSYMLVRSFNLMSDEEVHAETDRIRVANGDTLTDESEAALACVDKLIHMLP